jgi:hypothetical protein
LEVFFLYFAHSDIELLRLAGWCKNLPADISGMFDFQVFTQADVKQLVRTGLINVTSDGSIRLRDKGSRLIRHWGYHYHRDTKYRSGSETRRVEIARILLTFWRAGFQVYASTLEELGASQVFLSSMAARRDKSAGVWGGSVFWGLARFGQSVCSCYYAGDIQEQRINYKNERFTLNKAAFRFSSREAMLFAGPDLTLMARAFRNNNRQKHSDKETDLTFPQIRETVNHSLYLLPFGNDGAAQLRIMCEQNYRERLASAYFRAQNAEGSISAAPIGVTEADGMLGGICPWLVAVDMDIARTDRALRQTLSAGYSKLFVLCLESQKAALRQLYDENNVTLLIVPEECVLNAFGALPLFKPPTGVYSDREGRMLDASNLPVD